MVLLGETTSRHPPSSHPPFLDDLLSAPRVGGYALEPALLETGKLWRCILRVVSLRPSPARCLSEPQFPHLRKEAGDLLTCRICPCQVSPESEEGPGAGEGVASDGIRKQPQSPHCPLEKGPGLPLIYSHEDLSAVLCPSHHLCRAGPSLFWEPGL